MTGRDYPKVMIHPAHAPAVIGPRVVDGRGRVSYGQSIPERYPNVMVATEDQEEQARAGGYLAAGEAPPPPVAFSEYPLMMAHPEHRDSIPDEIRAERSDSGAISTWIIPGSPEVHAHLSVADAEAEAEAIGRGYMRMGVSDPAAMEAANASPYVPGRKHGEYPRWEDGVLVQDPNGPTGGMAQYPKWIASKGVVVNDAKEEAELLGNPWGLDPEKMVIDAPPLRDSLLEELREEMEALKRDVAYYKAQANVTKPTMEEYAKVHFSAQSKQRSLAQKARRARERAAKA